MAANDASEQIAKDLWQEWGQVRNGKCDIENLILKARDFEAGFFEDIVTIAERMGNLQKGALPVYYCNFCLEDYIFHAFSATDGYIVLADDYFNRLFFFLSLVLVMDTQGMIYEEERERIRDFVHEFVSEDYVHHRSFSYLHAPLTMDLLKRDPEVAEMANYFTNSLMAFIYSHEIRHHILGHTRGASLSGKATVNKRLQLICVAMKMSLRLMNMLTVFIIPLYIL